MEKLDELNKQVLELSDRYNMLFKELATRNSAALAHQPREGAWNVLEVLQHLYLAEKLSFGYIQKKSLDPSRVPPSKFSTKFKEKFMKAYLKYTPAFTAPKMVNEDHFQADYSIQQGEQEFKKLHEDMRAFFNKLPQELLDRNLYKHPVLGRVRLKSMMKFHLAHFDRHHKQMQNNLKRFAQ